MVRIMTNCVTLSTNNFGTYLKIKCFNLTIVLGRKPWFSCYGKRLTFWRSWVRIPAHFFTLICCKNCIVKTLTWGAWIAEWYHTRFWSLVHYAMPWAMSSSLGDNKLFFGPKHNIYTLFKILFGLFDAILLFVCQICHVNCETENWK